VGRGEVTDTDRQAEWYPITSLSFLKKAANIYYEIFCNYK
jgi:hypothetical protein